MTNKIMKYIGSAWGQRITIFVLVIIVMAIFAPNFFIPTNFRSILLAISIYGIMACGMLFVIVTGGIDLSIGSTAAMAGTLAAKAFMDSGYKVSGLFFGLLLAIVFCILLGLFHGIEITFFRMPAFVMTLATKYAIYGLIQVYTGARTIQPIEPPGAHFFSLIGQSRPLGIPSPVIIMLVIVVITATVLGKTTFGRRCYAVGGNSKAAELLGINTKRYTITVYVICSVICGIGGIVLASFNMSVNAVTASGYEGTVLTALVIGGINIFGGEGGVSGMAFGVLFVGVINNMMILLSVPPDWQKFVQGVIIIFAIAVNMHMYRRSMGLITSKRARARREAAAGTSGAGEE